MGMRNEKIPLFVLLCRILSSSFRQGSYVLLLKLSLPAIPTSTRTLPPLVARMRLLATTPRVHFSMMNHARTSAKAACMPTRPTTTPHSRWTTAHVCSISRTIALRIWTETVWWPPLTFFNSFQNLALLALNKRRTFIQKEKRRSQDGGAFFDASKR